MAEITIGCFVMVGIVVIAMKVFTSGQQTIGVNGKIVCIAIQDNRLCRQMVRCLILWAAQMYGYGV